MIYPTIIKPMITNHFRVTETPINSYAIEQEFDWHGLICFTYFSALKQYWNQFWMNSKTIGINMKNNFIHYPPFKWNYLVAVHSPKIMQKIS